MYADYVYQFASPANKTILIITNIKYKIYYKYKIYINKDYSIFCKTKTMSGKCYMNVNLIYE